MKRATVYMEDELHRALKIKSLESDTSVSQIVNDAVRDSLAEDLSDLSDIESRKGEKPISYTAFLKDLKSRGQL